MTYTHVIKASYGNDSIALMRWVFEHSNEIGGSFAVLYNDTGWARADWAARVERGEDLARSYGFQPHRTHSQGLEALVRAKKGWPRQGIQFCTGELKMKPTEAWLDDNAPNSIQVIGVRRAESANRSDYAEWSTGYDGRKVWAPMVALSEDERNDLVARAGWDVLPHRSMECFPCINSNRRDLRELALDAARIEHIAGIEKDMGFTSKGKPRTMFRPYRYMGAVGIHEIVRWAVADRGEFDPDDGGGAGCEAGWCGS